MRPNLPWQADKGEKSKSPEWGGWGGWRRSIYLMRGQRQTRQGGRGGPSWTPSQPLSAGTAVDGSERAWASQDGCKVHVKYSIVSTGDRLILVRSITKYGVPSRLMLHVLEPATGQGKRGLGARYWSGVAGGVKWWRGRAAGVLS